VLVLVHLNRRATVQAALPALLSNAFILVSGEQGRFLYLTAPAIPARTIVEFGTSFGIPPLYLVALLKGGRSAKSEADAGELQSVLVNYMCGAVCESPSPPSLASL
jgi:hypothetical protein